MSFTNISFLISTIAVVGAGRESPFASKFSFSLLFVAGVVILVYALYRWRKISKMPTVMGTVIDNITHFHSGDTESPGSSYTYEPVYRYEWGGKVYEARTASASSGKKIIGLLQRIHVDPSNPDKIYDQAESVFLIVFGLLFMIVPGVFLLIN